MPELPEVETIARRPEQRVSGDVIESIWLGEKPEPLKSPAPEIASAVEHTRILAVAASENTSSSTWLGTM